MMGLIFLAVIASIVSGIIVLIVRLVKQQSHLTDDEIQSIARLSPNDRNYNRVIGHLGTCEKCRNRMDDHNSMIEHLVG